MKRTCTNVNTRNEQTFKKNRFMAKMTIIFVTGLSIFGINSSVNAQPSQAHLLEHAGVYPNYPQLNYGSDPQKAELIKKGEYLAKAGDCIACHTQKGALPFSGGLPISTPFGIIYAPNITSDKKYGIGNWTQAQFNKAMREGVAPDGSNYFPVFPYPYFTKLTNDDLVALKAYFDAVPPVPQKNKGVDMPWPFSWRFLQNFWKLMYFHKGVYENDTKETKEWNRGAYLVQGLGHCGMCHTPLNILGAPEQKYALTGGFASGSYAPNISFSRLVNTSVSQVVEVFINNKLIGSKGQIVGPMSEVIHDSLEYLTEEDLAAIAMYLKTVKSKLPPVQNVKITSTTGQKLYDKYCVGCHGTGAGGAPKFGDGADWAPKLKLGMDNVYKNAINGIGGMPAKGSCGSCSDAEIKAAVDYIIQNSQTMTTAAKPLTASAQPSLVQGKRVYEEVCAICHAQGKLGAPVVGDQEVWAPLIRKNMDVLISNTIKGYKGMPARGACYNCTDNDLISAVIYMVNQSKSQGNYDLW